MSRRGSSCRRRREVEWEEERNNEEETISKEGKAIVACRREKCGRGYVEKTKTMKMKKRSRKEGETKRNGNKIKEEKGEI